uniref:Uncharacterized protein n=1 Tax=Mycena chlorophos TaxID=658473 RepID=A0ABQ0MD08_MYCCL|nr:predicted protein [Mycena chlorophos]
MAPQDASTNNTNTPAPVSAPSRMANNPILVGAIGAIVALCVAITILLVYKWVRKRRPESVAPSAAYDSRQYVYATLANSNAMTRNASEDSARAMLPKVYTPKASTLTLPTIVTDDTSSVSSYSPAVASSEIHEPSPIVPLSTFARLSRVCPCTLTMNTPSKALPASPALLALPPYQNTSPSRLQSIYADISRQKHSNPVLFAANVEWWQDTLEAVVSSGIQKTGSRIVLQADAGLMALLRVPGAGKPTVLLKPLSLPTVLQGRAPHTQITAYVVGKPLWWALEQLGVVGEDTSSSSRDNSWWGEYVFLSLVEQAADAVLAQQAENVGAPADALYSHEGFKKTFVPSMSEADMKILLRFLQRDRGAIVVDGDVIKFVDTRTAQREITSIDRGMLELKEAVQRLHAQIDDIRRKMDHYTEQAKLALQQKHKPVALTYLRQRKQFEDLLKKRLGSLETLEGTQLSVETAAGDVEILKSYETSTTTLRAILAHPSLQRDNIDKTMDALAEANADAQEINTAIEIGGNAAIGIASNPAFDEVDLERELAQLAEEAKKEDEEDALRKKLDRISLSPPIAQPETSEVHGKKVAVSAT